MDNRRNREKIMKINLKGIIWASLFGAMVLFYALFIWKTTWEPPEIAEWSDRLTGIQAMKSIIFNERKREYNRLKKQGNEHLAIYPYVTGQEVIEEWNRQERLLQESLKKGG